MYSSEPIIELMPFDDNEWKFNTPRLNLEAYDRFDDAIELFWAGNLKESERLFRHLIHEYSEFIDAYHHLAIILEETGRKQEAFHIWQKAVQITIDCFISEFCDDGKQLPWSLIDNRPFLRAYHGLGLMHLKRRDFQKALSIFSNILRMNPNDNQGVRALAIDCYFNLNSPQKVLDVCHDFPEDTDESLMYGKVLALFQIDKEGEAGEALRDAVNTLPLIAKEIIKRNHIKPKIFRNDYITIGGQDQAYYYWVSHGKYWRNTPGAIDFVKEWLDKHRK